MEESKVTLTNWKRLANVPANVNLGGVVQPGVHWHEHLVFLDGSTRQIYLYHIKMSVWSTMISNGMCNLAIGCPLAVFGDDQDLVLLSSDGSIYKYCVESGHWKIFDKLCGCSLINAGYSLENVVLASTPDQPKSMFLLWQEIKYTYNYSIGRNDVDEHLYVRRFQNSKWSDPFELKDNAFFNQLGLYSYAILQSDLYVNKDGSLIYCINAQNVVYKISLPSLTKTTICSVKDTMFSFGGQDIGKQPGSDISRYNPHTKEWEPAGYMHSCRYSVIAVPLLRDKNNVDIFVVGGKFIESADCKITETYEVNTC